MAKPLVPGLLCFIVDGDVNHVCTLLANLANPCVCVCAWCICLVCVCVCVCAQSQKHIVCSEFW